MENLIEIVNKRLDEIKGFIEANNYKLLKLEKNYCEMEGIITKTSTNHLNFAHGGYIFGLADTTAGVLAMIDGKQVVTIDSSINYFKPANGNKIIAIAKPLKIGKNIIVYEVIINNEANELIAKVTLSYFVL